jgi:hypothetical protein
VSGTGRIGTGGAGHAQGNQSRPQSALHGAPRSSPQRHLAARVYR